MEILNQIVRINFNNFDCNDLEYWNNLETIVTSTQEPIGEVIEEYPNDFVLVEFRNRIEKILKSDLIVLP
jgi:hypothetical protein